MAITQSAKKNIRQSARKKVMNLVRKDAMKEIMKQVAKLKAAGKTDAIAKLIPVAYKAIDKAAKRGVINKKNAARKKALVAKGLSKKSA